ncbi:glutamate-rich protein 6-like [Thunnus thynnus]|uniref:glutamate-rich protein 6-like n=1 Tax=Thunnus thynnus TaxID=8237 RepID=UPI0035276B4C
METVAWLPWYTCCFYLAILNLIQNVCLYCGFSILQQVKGFIELKMQTLDTAGKSVEMDSSASLGLETIQSVSSREYLTIHAYDGRVVTRVSVGTQTDWRHKEECSQDYKYPNQETSKAPQKNLVLTFEQMSVLSVGEYHQDGLQQQTQNESIPKSMKSELEISPDNEVLDSLIMETPLACQGETEESLTNLDKIPASSGSDSSEESLQTVLNTCCEYCRQLKEPPVTSDQLANSVDPKEFFCCEDAWEFSDIWLKGAAVSTKETVTDWDPVMERDQRLKCLEFQRSSYHQTPKAEESATLHYRLSDDGGTAKDEISFPEIEIMDSENTVSLNGEHAALKRNTPLVKHYNSGQTFIMIFPDGTGQVCYPSGRLAILVSAAQSADWYYVVLEDKHLHPHIQAVFMTGGQGTCYHKNGCIWLNLTPRGGTYCTDTGALKKNWSWLDNTHHVHAPPCQPLCLTLSPNLNIRIQSQEHIYLTFTSGRCSVRFNIGAKLKLHQGKGLTLPGSDMLQRYLQQKSAEINVLLQNIQSLITYQKTVGQQKVKPQQSLISQMERRRLPMKQQRSAKKTP